MNPAPPPATPHAVENEKLLIGCALQAAHWNETLDDMLATVRPEWFFVPAHRECWVQIEQMNGGGVPVELATLTRRLRESGKLEDMGGAAALAEAATAALSPACWRHYAAPVERAAKARLLLQVANEIGDSARDAAADMDGALDAAVALLCDQQSGRNCEAISAAEWIGETLETIQRDITDPPGWRCGIASIHEAFGRFQPETLITIGARPRTGKTALLMRLVEDLCLDQGIPALLFSLEMSRRQLGKRQIAMTGRVPLPLLMGNRKPGEPAGLPAWAMSGIQTAAMRWGSAPLWIDDSSGLTISQVVSRTRRHVRKHGVKLVAIDYLQLIGGVQKKSQDDKRARIEECTKALVTLKKQTGVCILLLCQANRDSVGETPQLHHLEGASSIEQDSDAVVFLHRHSELPWDDVSPAVRKAYLSRCRDDESLAISMFEKYAELVIRKNRYGPGAAKAALQFDGPSTRFDSWAA